MNKLAIIGGYRLKFLSEMENVRQIEQQTAYGAPSDLMTIGRLANQEIIFFARHGKKHHIVPHRINYRANIQALKNNQVTDIIAINTVGGITTSIATGSLVVPNQIIDYTWGREHSYCIEDNEATTHIDFSYPYCEALRQQLLAAANMAKLSIHDGGTYGATQGPRLETAAEIIRMERDGCDLVGMTGMPEAALAKELDINYASLCLVVNPAAGKSHSPITMLEIQKNIKEGMTNIAPLLLHLIRQYHAE